MILLSYEAVIFSTWTMRAQVMFTYIVYMYLDETFHIWQRL